MGDPHDCLELHLGRRRLFARRLVAGLAPRSAQLHLAGRCVCHCRRGLASLSLVGATNHRVSCHLRELTPFPTERHVSNTDLMTGIRDRGILLLV